MKPFVRAVVLAALLPVVLATTQSSAASPLAPVGRVPAGYVVDYATKGGGRVVGAGQGAPLKLGAPVAPGDVVVADAGTYVDLDLGASVVRIIGCSGKSPPTRAATCSPYRVPTPPPAQGVSIRLQALMKLIAWRSDETYVQARTRDGERLRVPLLEGSSARLTAGPRRLRLAWFGGKGPFHWVITSGQTVIAEATASADARDTEVDLTLPVGLASFRVTDAAGARLNFPVLVVAAPKSARVDPGARDGALEAAAQRLALDDGAWRLQVAQDLSVPNASRAQRALRDALELGDRP